MSKPLPGQLDLFGTQRTGRDVYDEALARGTEAPAIKLNSTVEPHDVKRLTDSCYRLVDRLNEGPATGDELAAIAGRRFSARLGEARDNKLIRGWAKKHIGGGTWEYRLIGGGG